MVKGNHKALGEDEYSANYLYKGVGGKNILVACDTGYYSEETLDYLTGHRVDTLILDATHGYSKERGVRGDTHPNFYTFIELVQEMDRRGILTSSSQIYATHFSCSIHKPHHEIYQWFQEKDSRIKAAFDGLKVMV